MILRDGRVLLEYTDLVNSRCLTVAMYKHGTRDGRIQVVQRGNHGRVALLDWTSLADRFKAMVREHLGGDPEQLARTQALERFMTLRPDDERHIDEYRAGNGFMLTEERRRELKRCARVMSLLAELADMTTAEVRAQFGVSILQLKASIIDYLKAFDVDLPRSFPRLEAKKRAYLQAREKGLPGASALVHGGHGNANGSKLLDPLQQGALETLASRHQNFSFRAIADHYNMVAANQGWPSLSANTVKRYLSKGSVSRTVTFFAKGAAAYQKKHGIIVNRSGPSNPTYMWVHDGTTYELYYQREATHKAKTAQWLRKEVCVVLDPHTWYPVGYAIGDIDNIELTRAAMRSAVAHMRELTGRYVLPYQVQSDKLGYRELGDWYDEMGIKHTIAKVGNSRSKVIEPYFNHHHSIYVKPFCPNWGGHNITSRFENQPNPDALERTKNSFPNEAGVIAQIHEAFARERADKRETYVAALRTMEADALRAISRERYLETFGVRHDWQNELTNRGLCPTLLGDERVYNLFRVDFQEHVSSLFQVYFDPSDLSDVLAVSIHGKLRYLVPEVAETPMALRDHTPETRAHLAYVQAFKADLGQAALDRRETSAERARIVAARMLDAAAEPVDLRKHVERVLQPTPHEEVVTRSYVRVKGSHKEALRQAQAIRNDPEAHADAQL